MQQTEVEDLTCWERPVDMRDRLDDARSGDRILQRLRLRVTPGRPPLATASVCSTPAAPLLLGSAQPLQKHLFFIFAAGKSSLPS